jgi:hypothetical protein
VFEPKSSVTFELSSTFSLRDFGSAEGLVRGPKTRARRRLHPDVGRGNDEGHGCNRRPNGIGLRRGDLGLGPARAGLRTAVRDRPGCEVSRLSGAHARGRGHEVQLELSWSELGPREQEATSEKRVAAASA